MDRTPDLHNSSWAAASADTTSDDSVKKLTMAGDTQMARLMRAHDWSKTPLGPVFEWPQSLRTAVSLILNSQHPMWIGWGPEAIFLYNDAYIQVLSLAKHPWALGKPAREVWSEIWDVCGPLADKVFQNGEPSFLDDVRLFMNRGDYLEETYYSFSYSPIRDESGAVGGLFCPSAEATSKVLNARRLKTLSELSSAAFVEKTVENACASATRTLAKNRDDVPFALLYLLSADGNEMHLEAHTPLAERNPQTTLLVTDVATWEHEGRSIWEVTRSAHPQVTSLAHLPSLPLGPAEQKLCEALMLPVKSRTEDRAIGVLVAGVNPTRRLDDDYRTFYELVAGHVATAIGNAQAYEEERKRAEALAELDRAKTAFFSNVSHEFRTPLTLMLGPLEEVLQKPPSEVPPENRHLVETAHRNGTRLLKLVNSLLDFSRIEAGRIHATYQPVELAGLTRELASVFRSATDRAGLTLNVKCVPLSEPVFVDREMWEKIVLNLLSNAFKFTFEGEISVRLEESAHGAELTIRDTGVGIPKHELPKLFARFHRVEGARGRSFEGSGIGLALVQELVKLHGGTISVSSEVDKGSTFQVSIPFGSEHLPRELVKNESVPASGALAAPYITEALSWLGNPAVDEEASLSRELLSALPGEATPVDTAPRILLVDDNRDMRDYLQRLLSTRFRVIPAENGRLALERAFTDLPDLVLTDIMMPEMDGLELLRRLRENPETRTIPIILLSARAGSEAPIEGLQHGADDYLIKPFSARELLARVQTHVELARLRKSALETIAQSEERFRAIVDTTPECVKLVAADGTLLHINLAGANMLDADVPEELVGKSTYDVIAPEDRESFRQFNERICQGEKGVMEFDIVGLRHTRRHMETHAAPFRHAGGAVQLAVTRDITLRKKNEEELRRRAAQFETVLNQAPVGVYVLDNSLRIRQVNPVARPLFGNIQSLIGIDFGEVIRSLWSAEYAEKVLRLFRHTLLTGDPYETSERTEYQIDRMPAEYYAWRIDRIPLPEGEYGLVCYVRDISAEVHARATLREQEERIRKMEKIAAAGKLAASLAHEINNPLSSVMNALYLLQTDPELDSTAQSYVGTATNELGRVVRIVQQSLSYHRIDTRPRDIDMAKIVDDSLQIFADKFRRAGIELHAKVKSGCLVYGVADQMRQVVDNLLLNAIEAMPNGGNVAVSLHTCSVWNPRKRRGICLTIADSGPGITREIRSRIFEPFFTTKSEKGTGLGLWVLQGIVSKHEGTIRVRTSDAPGKSRTIFSVFFPSNAQATLDLGWSYSESVA